MDSETEDAIARAREHAQSRLTAEVSQLSGRLGRVEADTKRTADMLADFLQPDVDGLQQLIERVSRQSGTALRNCWGGGAFMLASAGAWLWFITSRELDVGLQTNDLIYRLSVTGFALVGLQIGWSLFRYGQRLHAHYRGVADGLDAVRCLSKGGTKPLPANLLAAMRPAADFGGKAGIDSKELLEVMKAVKGG